MTTFVLPPNRRRIAVETLILITIWIYSFAGVLFTERFWDPIWHSRVRWSTWPALIVVSWILFRSVSIGMSPWALRLEDGRLDCRASYQLDLQLSIDDVVRVTPLKQGPAHFTIIETTAGKKYWIFDRFVNVDSDTSLATMMTEALSGSDNRSSGARGPEHG